MIESVEFKNFRVLRSAELRVGSCTLLLGPNGAGKSTAFRALELMAQAIEGKLNPHGHLFVDGKSAPLMNSTSSAGAPAGSQTEIAVECTEDEVRVRFKLVISGGRGDVTVIDQSKHQNPDNIKKAAIWLRGLRVFSLDPAKIAQPARLEPTGTIQPDGSHLSIVLTQLQDKHPERFDGLNQELSRWLPEFDRVLFDITPNGERSLMLRTKVGRHPIKATDLSAGTLLILCVMSLAHLADPPTCICLEEPDHGIHPRLLRQVHDAMMRLSNPAASGDSRKPVQVIATTHSPYFLDLFRDHPNDVVIAEKTSDGAKFSRLTDISHYNDIMHDAQLGDAWYSGVLGGVPQSP